MQELLVQLIAYARSAWRFRWIAIATAWVVCLTGWAVVAVLKDVYEAEASVYVDTTSQLRRLLDEQIIEPNVDAQLQYVRQALLGQVTLQQVAQANDLLLEARTPADEQKVIDRLAQTILIEASAPTSRDAANLYRITFRHEDRRKAVEVVNTLLNRFMESTLRAQQTNSEISRRFLLEQVREYEQRLAEAEQRLADFNRKNFERLPGREGGYFERLQQEMALLDQARQKLRAALSERESIEQQLRGETPWTQPVRDVDPTSLAGRIIQTQARLDELLLRYTENHPDVIAAQETLTRLQEQQRQELERAGTGSSGALANPVYQALQIAKNQAQTNIAALQADLANRERRVAELRSLIDEMPSVEAELARLNRDYDVVQAQYRSLLQSLEKERLSSEAQRTEQVDFRIITPPTASLEPVAPKREAFVPLVFVLGIGAGGALAVVLSLIRPVFNDPGMLESWAGLPVIGTVSPYWSAANQSQRRRALAAFGAACFALVIVFSGVFVVEVLGPGLRSIV